MRIALFTDQYAPQVSGVTLTLSRLVERACELGHGVHRRVVRGAVGAPERAPPGYLVPHQLPRLPQRIRHDPAARGGLALSWMAARQAFGNVVMEAFASGLPVIAVNGMYSSRSELYS